MPARGGPLLIVASLVVRHKGCVTEVLPREARAAQISSDLMGDVLVVHARTPEVVDEFFRLVVADQQRHAQPRPPVVMSREPLSMVFRFTNPATGVVGRILRAGCAIAWPVVWADGRERYRVLAPSRAALEEAVRDVREVGEVEILHVGEAPNQTLDITTTVGGLVADLTQRQLELLRAAIDAGYYATPRGTTTAQLAATLGIGQTTLSEHLRKAEGRLMERFAELLALAPVLASGATRKAGRPRRRPGPRAR